MENREIACNGCDAHWGGIKTSHCASCHQTFTTLRSFDVHRTGSHVNGTRHCADPAAMGLTDAGRKYPCWGQPADDWQFPPNA